MKVRPADPNAVIRYPSDPRRLVPPEGCEMPGVGADAEHFQRLLLTKELLVVDGDIDAPTGREPTTPITTR